MKLSMIAIIGSLAFGELLFAKSASSQIANSTVTVSINSDALKASIESIEKQTRIKFSFNSYDLDGYNTEAHNYSNETLAQILKCLLNKTQLDYKEINNSIVIYAKAANTVNTTPSTIINAEKANINIKGKVTDDNEPLPGVSVKIDGTSTGVLTDLNGNYSISVPDNAVLVFTYIGYATQKVNVGSQSTVNVNMIAESKSLNEVVVVGYGVQKKSDVTGSITSISAQALKDVPAANLVQALQGQGTGIDVQKSGGNSHPGSVPSIIIRGTRSKQASNDPLFVVDGIPFTGNIQDLNLDDVASVEVLKDASSTAIYGSRGANGVILITTKRGKIGEPVVTYSAYAGYSKPIAQYNVMNADQYALLKKWAYYNAAAANPLYTSPDDPRILTSGAFGAQELTSLQTGRNTNWQDLIYKNGFLTNHQIGVSGGTEKTKYDISAGYYNETGIYGGQQFTRYSIKVSLDQNIGKSLKIGLSSLNNLTYIDGENANPLGQALRASPLATPYDDVTGALVGYVNGSANQVWNPLANLVPGASVETRKRLGTFTTAYAELNLAPGLKYRFNGGAEIKPEVYGNFYAAATYNNQGAQSSANNQSKYNYNYTIENIITYDKVIAKKHHISFTGLYSLQENQSQNNSFSYNNLLSDGVQYFNPAVGSNLTGTGSYAMYDLISYMGRLNYGYNDKYLFTVTLRSDGSSKLAPGNKYHLFPSTAFAWNVLKEPIFKDSKILSNLKIRLSYGDVGNAAINPYQTLGGLSTVTYNYGTKNTIGAYPTSAPNTNLDWEYTRTLNAGIDFGLWGDRVTGSVDAYHEFTRSLLLPETLPPTSGIPNAVLTNVGKSENVGIEINLNTVNIAAKGKRGFSWNTNFNITFNRGKVTELANGTTVDISNNLFVGQPLGAIFDYKKVGIWQNTAADTALAKKYGLTITGGQSVIGSIKVLDLNNDNKLDANDRMIIGTDQPLFSGGITNRFGYKGFDFTVVAAYRVGGTLTSQIYQSGSFLNTLQGNYNNLNYSYWTPTNHENYFPKPTNALTNTQYSSTLSYFSATYVKIRSISLGYVLPKSLITHIGAKSLKVYATAQNPFTLFSPYKNIFHGIDPESAGKLGEDTPATWSMTFGINLTL
ncbi:TonB-dependent receptor [Mucilaginibacter sp.]|uniref:TonB-dependent receptor n=1 Tax=Mucilaginibacter sp. TaxID=1882438 RepID=UPI003264C74C